jgi:hypothetical protein
VEYFGVEKWRRVVKGWAGQFDCVALLKGVVTTAGIALIAIVIWRIVEKNFIGFALL